MTQQPTHILELIDRFDRNPDSYKSSHYNETQLRREFLNPFFKTLGWDIDNEQGYAEAYKDVIHEDAIKVGEAIDGITRAIAWIALDNPAAARRFYSSLQGSYARFDAFLTLE